jgi:hypothetical protein
MYRLFKTCPISFKMLTCNQPGERRLADFDVAAAMREADDDRS